MHEDLSSAGLETVSETCAGREGPVAPIVEMWPQARLEALARMHCLAPDVS